MSSAFVGILMPTFSNAFHDCTYFLLVVLFGCMNYGAIANNDNVVQPPKKPLVYFNDAGTELHLYEQEELSQYDGIQNPEMYLSIMGKIFDVTEAPKHYGPGSTYHIFVGRDNSKAFITGQFTAEDISDDILSLPPADVLGIQHWVHFYKKTYTKKGKLIGRYYDSSGKLTPYGKGVRNILKQSQKDFANKAAIKNRFPDCNVEWEPQKGSKFWCSNQSGGIKRDWEGFPKQLFLPGSEPRCACIQENEIDTLENIKPYSDCQDDEKVCFIQPVENVETENDDELKLGASRIQSEL